MESTNTEGLRDQAWTEGGSSVEGHEESQSPHVVSLIMLLSFLPKQVILMSRKKRPLRDLRLPISSCPMMMGWTLDATVTLFWNVTQFPPLLSLVLSTFLSPSSRVIFPRGFFLGMLITHSPSDIITISQGHPIPFPPTSPYFRVGLQQAPPQAALLTPAPSPLYSVFP